MESETKYCKGCTQSLPLDSFWAHPTTSDRKQPLCKTCKPLANLKYKKDYEYRRQYGISYTEFVDLWEKQGHKCACCDTLIDLKAKRGASNRACLDHCHATGRVRGILCSDCNLGLGCFRDDIARLSRAIEYLNHQ